METFASKAKTFFKSEKHKHFRIFGLLALKHFGIFGLFTLKHFRIFGLFA